MAPQNKTPSLIHDEKPDGEAERVLKAGRILASPAPGEDVVISGMAGRFPDSDDVYHYRFNLENKIDMVSGDNRRWEPTHPEIPQRTGKINFVDKFDAGYFGVHYRQAHSMDPMCRQLIERAIEAVMDAGLNLNDLKGSNTGVFIGACFSETEKTWFYDRLETPSFGLTGCVRSALAQRISYYLELKGPSYTIDTACSSSLYALEHGYRAVRQGLCETAIVGGVALCLHPIVSLQFARLGVLSLDGSCKSFDADANGYARSETISAIILQKSKDAKRIYAQIVHAKANCDGFKEQGITFPSGSMQKQLLEEVYREANVDPATVDFLEAHATGTKVGDPEEIMAMDEIFCVNRTKPLLLGSIKSNLGHTEPSSGLCSIVKVLLGMEGDCLLPNINYTHPREGAEALEKGRLVVVTEKTPWPKDGSGLAAVNSFGFGGANCHVLLKRFNKRKINNSQPRDELPRLICLTGRTKDAILYVMDDISMRPLDAEFVKMLQDSFSSSIAAHPYRGYIIMSKSGERSRSWKQSFEKKMPICAIFAGPSAKWMRVGKQLFALPLFAATIQKIHNILSAKGVNVTEIISEGARDFSGTTLGTVAIQVALVDILKILEVKFDYFIGHSTGELVAAYADGCLTLEQTIMMAYHLSSALAGVKKGTIAAYSLHGPIQEIGSNLPKEVEIIGHITCDNVIISGPVQKASQFVSGLKGKEVREVESVSVLHTKNMAGLGPTLLKTFREIIPKPKRRSNIWLSSNKDSHASPEYFVNAFLTPIMLQEILSVVSSACLRALDEQTAMIEIGSSFVPNSLSLVPVENGLDDVHSFLCGLGRLHEVGQSLKIDRLYPKVQFPVSTTTPMISPLLKWNHEESWFVALYKAQEKMKTGERAISVAIKESDWSFLSGHVIDGRTLMPATGYLLMVWETFAMMLGSLTSEMKVIFENVKFHRATPLVKAGSTAMSIMVQKGTGQFEISETNQTVVSGRICVYEDGDASFELARLPIPLEDESPIRFNTKDIYKELKLRGYNYTGTFRALQECDLSASKGSIVWTADWISFMDNMLQIKLLQEDTRNLYVPTGIERLIIDAAKHIGLCKSMGENPHIPVYLHKETDIIKSGFIEIRGLQANSIARRKPLGEPVLETHKFIPLESTLSLDNSIRVISQLYLENNYNIKLRMVELIDEATDTTSSPIGPILHQAFSDQPLIQAEVVVMSKEPMELENVSIEDKKLTAENRTCNLVIVSKLFERSDIMSQALNALKENGAIISREDLSFVPTVCSELDILATYDTETEKIVFSRKHVEFVPNVTVDITENFNYNWLPSMQTALKNDEKILVVAQNAPMSGIMGFINCLRREPGGINIKCVFTMEDAPKFNPKDEFYSKQLSKSLSLNVFKDGKWGTYRHLLLPKAPTVEHEHIYNNVTVRGDLSSLRWIEGPYTSKSIMPPEKVLVHIYYASINFRDIMTASGRISNDVVTRDRMEQYNVQGFEFAGRNSQGKRVMGMVTSGALASMVNADSYLIWDIPEHLTMEEAATIPVTYGTVMHGMIIVAQLKRGQSVLIHAGSGGVGQAAINVALYLQCNIFTTVGTPEKKEFIRKTFPQIPESHIGNSRDTSFEQMVYNETKGRGVDAVLNSLAEDKLKASVRCLAAGGKFLEIGKFDLASNNELGLKLFTEGRSFHGVMLDAFFVGAPKTKENLGNLIIDGLSSGMVKPLNRTIFKEDEVEQAFRFMAGGKHIGKVMIKLRDEEPQKEIVPKPKLFHGIPRFYGNPENTYIIVGGLGGFGLELADWLILRGAKKLVLVSRSGLKNGYQASRLRIWKSYGVTTTVSTDDVTTRKGCMALLQEADKLGPVQAIFNLAAVLKDGLLENQNEDNFITSLSPKALATQYLDEVSRELCPHLQYFIVFSSVVCGRGNAGQTNYGMANSIMERICEKRKKDGYPATAIQWGAIGEVGLVAEMQELQTDIEIGGTLQQRVSSCLQVMDVLLRQDEPVVGSMVVAEKRVGFGGASNIVDAVKNILGFKDLKTISLHSSLSELGMDSMMAVEIKQTLEREYEVFLTAQDIRGMTFARLQEIAHEKLLGNEAGGKSGEEREKLPQGVYLLFRYMGDEEKSCIPMLRLTSLIKEKAVAPKVFLMPGIEGLGNVLEMLAANLASHAYCLQYTYNHEPEQTVEKLAERLLPQVQDNLPRNTPFTLVAYSYGAIIALHLASLLEADGRIGRVILIDGSPFMFKELVNQQVPEAESEPHLQTIVLCALMQLFIPLEAVMKHKNDIFACKTFDERIELAVSRVQNTSHSDAYRRQVCAHSYYRLNSVLLYQPKFPKLKSMVKLFKPSRATITSFAEDYELHKLCENPVEVSTFEGNHLTILKNTQVSYAINTIIDTSSIYFKQSLMKEKLEAEIAKEVATK